MLIDVNWRPVFWEGVESPRELISSYIAGADIVKLSEEEAEWLLGIPGHDALGHPCKVQPGALTRCPWPSLTDHGAEPATGCWAPC